LFLQDIHPLNSGASVQTAVPGELTIAPNTADAILIATADMYSCFKVGNSKQMGKSLLAGFLRCIICDVFFKPVQNCVI
jgi:hypothetical protein